MSSKLLPFLALGLGGGLVGCSTIHPTVSDEQANAPLFIYYGSEAYDSATRLLSMRVIPGESFEVGGDDFWEVKGCIKRDGSKWVADVMSSDGPQGEHYQGRITLDKPFYGEGGAASGGAGGPTDWFMVSTNSDCRAILERVNASLDLAGQPFSHQPEFENPPKVRPPEEIDPTTGLPKDRPPLDPTTGLPWQPKPKNQPLDIRSLLLASARKEEAGFPDGHNVLLTHFSDVGQLVTADGEVIYVADQRAVIADQISPHGLNYIVFFDREFHVLGRIGYVNSRPLWCDGGKLYLFGDLDSRVSEYAPGNVVDVTDGFDSLKIYHAKVYGSSGGVKD